MKNFSRLILMVAALAVLLGQGSMAKAQSEALYCRICTVNGQTTYESIYDASADPNSQPAGCRLEVGSCATPGSVNVYCKICQQDVSWASSGYTYEEIRSESTPVIPSNCELKYGPCNIGGGARPAECKPPDCVKLSNPLVGADNQTPITTVPQLIGTVIRAVLGLVGALALLVFFQGGIIWLISAGNEEKVKEGTKKMLFAAIGLIIIFSSYMIVNIWMQRFLFGGQ